VPFRGSPSKTRNVATEEESVCPLLGIFRWRLNFVTSDYHCCVLLSGSSSSILSSSTRFLWLLANTVMVRSLECGSGNTRLTRRPPVVGSTRLQLPADEGQEPFKKESVLFCVRPHGAGPCPEITGQNHGGLAWVPPCCELDPGSPHRVCHGSR